MSVSVSQAGVVLGTRVRVLMHVLPICTNATSMLSAPSLVVELSLALAKVAGLVMAKTACPSIIVQLPLSEVAMPTQCATTQALECINASAMKVSRAQASNVSPSTHVKRTAVTVIPMLTVCTLDPTIIVVYVAKATETLLAMTSSISLASPLTIASRHTEAAVRMRNAHLLALVSTVAHATRVILALAKALKVAWLSTIAKPQMVVAMHLHLAP